MKTLYKLFILAYKKNGDNLRIQADHVLQQNLTSRIVIIATVCMGAHSGRHQSPLVSFTLCHVTRRIQTVAQYLSLAFRTYICRVRVWRTKDPLPWPCLQCRGHRAWERVRSGRWLTIWPKTGSPDRNWKVNLQRTHLVTKARTVIKVIRPRKRQRNLPYQK